MVQQIYNNYSPQYYYNNQRPGEFPAYIAPNYAYQQDIYQRPVLPQQQRPVPQFIQRLPQFIPQLQERYYTPETTAATQNIFNAPNYGNLYYRTPVPIAPNAPVMQAEVAPVQTQVLQAPVAPIMPAPVQTPVTNVQEVDLCPWVNDPELKFALNKLGEITHDPADVNYLESIGITLPFNSGKEALDFLRQSQLQVVFADFGDSLAHAQYNNDEGKVLINQKYKGQMTLPMALAIADAIYHEVGHAKDRDGVSSIQEELDCLALNVMGYRYQQRKYPEITNAPNQSRLISDGVALYPKLFFDPDPTKMALIKRVTEKYGFLPVITPNHQLGTLPLAQVIKENHNLQSQVKQA